MDFWFLMSLGVAFVICVIWLAYVIGRHHGYEVGEDMGKRYVSHSLWKKEEELPIGEPLLCLGSVKTETFFLSCIYLGREPAEVSSLVGNYVFVLAPHPFPRLFQLGVKETPEPVKAE